MPRSLAERAMEMFRRDDLGFVQLRDFAVAVDKHDEKVAEYLAAALISARDKRRFEEGEDVPEA